MKEELHGLALCAGIGGLELGVGLVIPSHRVLAYVEREAFAAAVLVARMEEKALDPAPIWDDLTTLDCGPLGDRVDLVTAGFPCQPFSVAGKRLGENDERWIWDHIERILREVRPPLVFLENVPGLLASAGGMPRVLGDLARLRLDAEWGILSAAAIGAPHLRRRVFILGHDQRGRDLLRRHLRDPWDRPALSDARGELLRVQPGRLDGESRTRPAEPRELGPDLADARLLAILLPDRNNPDGCHAPIPLWPPGPGHQGPWPSGLEPAIRRTPHGLPDRVDRLHALGNAVVPIQAARALLLLARRALERT